MVGTLTVQNLQGPASGANANKVIIPSGHVLDVSGGTLVPSAGQVIQVAKSENLAANVVTSSSTAFSTVVSMTFAPKEIGSLLHIQVTGVVSVYGTGGTGIIGLLSKDGVYLEQPPANGADMLSYVGGNTYTADRYTPLAYTKYTTSTASSHTFTFYVRKYSATGDSVTVNAGWSPCRMTITEIAQ